MTMKQSHRLKQNLSDNKEKNQTKSSAGETTNDGNKKMKSADIKNAHASGIGAMERSDENQLENLNYTDREDNEIVY